VQSFTAEFVGPTGDGLYKATVQVQVGDPVDAVQIVVPITTTPELGVKLAGCEKLTTTVETTTVSETTAAAQTTLVATTTMQSTTPMATTKATTTAISATTKRQGIFKIDNQYSNKNSKHEYIS
tara:strand:+ start:676 stop:1047 length:372 start_codon:yes stop_codon:yes gene_type:complete